MPSAFGGWLREARDARDLSTRELAELSGFSPGYINKLELGRQDLPKPDVVRTIASALGRPAEEALHAAGYATGPVDISPEAWEFDYLIQKVGDPRRRRQLMRTVRSAAELASVA